MYFCKPINHQLHRPMARPARRQASNPPATTVLTREIQLIALDDGEEEENAEAEEAAETTAAEEADADADSEAADMAASAAVPDDEVEGLVKMTARPPPAPMTSASVSKTWPVQDTFRRWRLKIGKRAKISMEKRVREKTWAVAGRRDARRVDAISAAFVDRDAVMRASLYDDEDRDGGLPLPARFLVPCPCSFPALLVVAEVPVLLPVLVPAFVLVLVLVLVVLLPVDMAAPPVAPS